MMNSIIRQHTCCHCSLTRIICSRRKHYFYLSRLYTNLPFFLGYTVSFKAVCYINILEKLVQKIASAFPHKILRKARDPWRMVFYQYILSEYLFLFCFVFGFGFTFLERCLLKSLILLLGICIVYYLVLTIYDGPT